MVTEECNTSSRLGLLLYVQIKVDKSIACGFVLLSVWLCQCMHFVVLHCSLFFILCNT